MKALKVKMRAPILHTLAHPAHSLRPLLHTCTFIQFFQVAQSAFVGCTSIIERWLLVSSLWFEWSTAGSEFLETRLCTDSRHVWIFKMGDDETSGVLIGSWFFGCCRRPCLGLCCVIIFTLESMLYFQVQRVVWRWVVAEPMSQSGRVIADVHPFELCTYVEGHKTSLNNSHILNERTNRNVIRNYIAEV